jgi:hypothetical protein
MNLRNGETVTVMVLVMLLMAIKAMPVQIQEGPH